MKISRRTLIKIFLTLVIGLALMATAIFIFMQQKVFGKVPTGSRLDRIKKSPNYKDGAFQNLIPTDVMLKEASYFKMMKDFFNKPKTTAPPKILPSVKTDLHTLPTDTPVIVWFGHSSYLIRTKDITILVDPVLSGNASPVSFFGKSFPGSDIYRVEDLPAIDAVIISHDHYDHLDYETITKLKAETSRFYTALGVGAHLEHWGIDSKAITELDWWETSKIVQDFEITATPARHFSGRSFSRGKTLWASFVLKIHGYSIFIGGDSGYDSSFKTIGEQYGPFDIAMLESGQYGKDWPYIHMMPEETISAAKDLKTKVLLPVHWSKFVLANHSWNEPIQRLVASASENGLIVTTPMIGEMVRLEHVYPQKVWWNL